MIREIIIIASIIIIIFAGDFLTTRYLEKTSDKLIGSLKELKEHAIEANKNENRDLIKEEMKQMEENWEKTSEIWSVIVMHQEIDNIEQALIKSKAMINDGNIEDAIPELETAIFYVEHVNAREKLKLKNIF